VQQPLLISKWAVTKSEGMNWRSRGIWESRS